MAYTGSTTFSEICTKPSQAERKNRRNETEKEANRGRFSRGVQGETEEIPVGPFVTQSTLSKKRSNHKGLEDINLIVGTVA